MAEQRKHLFAYFQTAIAGINAINKGQCGVTVIVIQRKPTTGESLTAREVEDVTDVMTSPFRLWARGGAEQINGVHSTCPRGK
ncbi:hypothetical protein ACVXG7_11525 [Enterobacter hormaechei]